MTDGQARDIVIKGIDKNVFTPAGAGSGKTTSLVDRLVTMVKEGINVDNICTITFTVNAANEFYERFQKKLIKEAQGIEKIKSEKEELLTFEKNTVVIKQLTTEIQELKNNYDKLINALNNIDNCFMGTIDSFFQTVVKENAINTNFPIGIQVSSIEDFEIFLYNEFEKFGKSTDLNVKSKIEELVENFGVNAKKYFVEIYKDFYQYRKYAIQYNKVNKSRIDALELKYKNKIINVLTDATNNPSYGCNNIRGEKPNERQINIYTNYVKQFNKINCNWFSNLKILEEYFDVIKDYNANSKTNVIAALGVRKAPQNYIDFKKEIDELKQMFEEISDSISSYYATVLFDNALYFMDTIYQDKLDNSLILFDDVIQCFYDLLVDDINNNSCNMINRIKSKYQYFLLDEFQDTKPVCSDIFYILASSMPNLDINKCVLDKGKIFIVGDSKQSIYKFSGADIVAFNRIGNHFYDNPAATDVKAKLTKNFRSVDSLKNWFNTKFNSMFTLGTYQTNFDPIDMGHINKKLNHFYDLKKNVITDAVFKYETNSEDDCENIVKIIKTIVKNDNYKIEYPYKDDDDKEQIEVRPIEFSDIMVITSAKTNLFNYVNGLSKAKIPFYIEGNNIFSCSSSFLTIMSILSVLIKRDSVSLFRLLSSDIIKLDDNQLYYLKSNDLFSLDKIEKLKELGYVDLANLFEKLEQLSQQITDLPLSSLYEKIIVEFDILNKCEKVGFQYTYSALESLKAAEANGEVCTINDGLSFLEGLLNNKQERTFSINEKQNAVHLANLHKVKGMEAPIVILAYSWNKNNGCSYSVDNEKKIIYPIKAADGCQPFANAQIKALIEEEKKATEAELIRLLYVAATRAGHALIISDIISFDKDGNPKSDGHNYWKGLLDSNLQKFETAAGAHCATIQVPDYKYHAKDKTEIDNCNSSSYNIQRPSDGFKYQKDETDDLPSIKKELSAVLVGTIVHKLMESIVLSKFNINVKELVTSVLMSNHIDLKYENDFIIICEKMLNEGYEQEKGIRKLFNYLKNNNAKCYCEVPFAIRDDKNNIVNGIIDLIYTIDDVNYFIVDYKTDAAVKDINECHKEQLICYEKAFKENYPNCNVESVIYHIDVNNEKI